MSGKKKSPWLKVFLAIVGALLLWGGWVLHNSATGPVEVRVASPVYRDVANLVTTNGVVEPMDQFQARANFPGMVDKVYVELGAKVEAGEMLVTMKDPFAVSRVATAASAVSSAEDADQNMMRGGSVDERIGLSSDLKHAKDAADSAQRSLDLLQQLQQQGAASSGEVENARKRVADTTATLQAMEQRNQDRYSQGDLAAARARVRDAQASLGAAQMAFKNANIASPMSGIVYSVSVAPYDFVPMGAELLRVADLNHMQIRSYFDEPEVGKLKAGQPVTVTWDGRPGLTWHGHIRQAPVGAMPLGTRSVAECLISMDDAKGDLLPNTHVIVTVPIDVHRHVLTVPRQALQTERGKTFVFRVIAGKLQRTDVRVGLVSLDLVEIMDGLTTNDVVALYAGDEEPLRDRMAVVPMR